MDNCSAAAERILKALEAEIVSRGGKLDNIKSYSVSLYAREIDNAAHTLWKNGPPGVARMLTATIRFGLRDAFDLGAADIGINPEDYINADLRDRDAIIDEEISHVPDLVQYLKDLANDPQAKLSDADNRLQMWKQTFTDMRTQAKLILGQDEKLEFVLGATEQHCKSCSKLNGIVKRTSFWRSHGVMPRNPPNDKLECGGWLCDCELSPTDKPCSKGKLPNLP